ncbi:MAG: polyphosphate kinase 2 family protein [Bacteroidales bacterium]|nr:polyphosphate kinase 2 family protein [Bacteroidales bacterium]MCF8387150.1 polyphosphate kinase 2 family protein [Bacteroidales bacterium]MCF8397636.1 polyphosphate kinase 2 family protein [Bacteroidales bacterium]
MMFNEFIFTPDNKKQLQDFKTSWQSRYNNKKEAHKELEKGIKKMRKLQDKLYASDTYALLIIFQAMDAAGKDGTIKHVMSGINPQGCQVKSFKAPSQEELDHGYMWRCMKELPERGKIGIFNRSYYEEVLVTRVHPEIIAKNQKIPGINQLKDIDDSFWQNRYSDIVCFEEYMNRNGIKILKFFLNISKEEQKQRFLKRINNPDKNWKISLSDFQERRYWTQYMKAYESMLQNTSTETAPWYVIPADNKPFMRAMVSDIIIHALESLNLQYPEVDEKKKQEISKAEEMLMKEE